MLSPRSVKKPKSTTRKASDEGSLPSRDDLLRYIAGASGEVTKRDLARAFKLKGQDRAELRAMIRDLQDDGLLVRGQKRRFRGGGRLPSVGVVEIVAIDEDGDAVGEPASKGGYDKDALPRIHLDGADFGRAPAIGDHVLARLTFVDGLSYEGKTIKVLPKRPKRVIGVVEQTREGLVVRPIDRRNIYDLKLKKTQAADAKPGELVVVESANGSRLDRGAIDIIERLGLADDASTISLLAAHHHDLRIEFPSQALDAADQATPAMLQKRADLRGLPLVTIDGSDARDFDDAVFAKPDDHPENPGGWRITVAIADVAHYVRAGDLLDLEARARGNSTYFPDRVLPMLPEALSNGLCSLRPDEDRACLAVHIWLDRNGNKRRHRFERALMRSRARLTYDQMQAARDGAPDDRTSPLLDTVIEPLYGAFEALLQARNRRGTLDLDLPELNVVLDEQDRPTAIVRAPRLDAHRLIEEFMIIANVAAAESLEKKATPCMHRVHDKPDQTKLEGLAQLMKSLGILKQSSTLSAKPKDLAKLLDKTREHPLSSLASNLLLRAQSQAVYTPHNIGHYGLNLGRYAHFTSPIRRYADLLVHRSLIRAHNLGGDGLADDIEIDALHELGAHISRLERRSMEAERSAKDRFVALLMAEQVGGVFAGRITSVHRFGLFVQLSETHADVLVPISTLSANRLDHDPARHALIDRRAGLVWSLGDQVEVELVEADTIMGRLAGRLVDHEPGPSANVLLKSRGGQRQKSGKRGRKRSKARIPR
ncbi:MAG: ribonuclease R [Geminicoccaceae bacterium]